MIGSISSRNGSRMYVGCIQLDQTSANHSQCICLGALFNQSAFLILIGLLKGRSVEYIVQSFRNVSLHS